MSRELRITLIASGALVLTGALLYASLFTLGVLPRLGFAPGYALTAASGDRLTSEDLRGSVVLYTFAPAGGDGEGRDTGAVMQEVRARLAPEDTADVPVRMVSIVLDTDAPPALAAAASRAGADGDVWRFASGPHDALRTVVRDGFGVWFDRQADGSVRYDPVFVVVDGMGIVRAHHRVGLPGADILLRDIRSILREARAATGPARLAYEAAHLFQCYPTR
jgi:protein SCO1